MKKILNLGCGTTRIPGSIGVDYVKLENYVDIVHDLDSVPYPFEGNSIDEIHFYHVLEHLHEPLKKLEELHRILKPGGVLYMRVPHYSSMGAFTNMTHLRPFGYTSFDIFDNNNWDHYYARVEFNILSKRIKYFGLYPNTGVYEKYIHKNRCAWFVKPFVLMIGFLINLSPIFFERFWCYWFGGAAEICIDLKKIK